MLNCIKLAENHAEDEKLKNKILRVLMEAEIIMTRKSDRGNIKRLDPPEEERRKYLKTVGALVVGLAVGGVAGWLSKPAERVEVPGVTVTAPGATVTERITETVTIPITPTPTPVVEEVRIGCLYPLSGALAKYGRDAKNTLGMAAEEINEAGGVKSLGGAKIRLIWADTEGKPETTIAEAERLITREKIHALYGCCISSHTLVASEVCERYKIPMVTGCSAATDLTRRGFQWFFRPSPNDEIFVKSIFEFLKDLQKKEGVELKSMAIMYDTTLFGECWAKSAKMFNEDPELGGYEIVADIPYSIETPDVTSEVMTLKAAKPDVLLISSILGDALLTHKTFKSLDFNCKVIVANDAGQTHPDLVKSLGKDADYIMSRMAWTLDVAKENSKRTSKKFYDRYGYNMDDVMARYYDDFYVLYYTIEAAGSVEPEKIREALIETDLPPEKLISPWDGVKFIPLDQPDGGQNMLARSVVAQCFDGTYYTIYPFEVASREYVYPMPTWAERGG